MSATNLAAEVGADAGADVAALASRGLVDIRFVCALYSTTEKTVRTWAKEGRVPAGFKLGGRRLWKASELSAHLEAGCPRVSAEAGGGKAAATPAR
jgi:hypothetical protein